MTVEACSRACITRSPKGNAVTVDTKLAQPVQKNVYLLRHKG